MKKTTLLFTVLIAIATSSIAQSCLVGDYRFNGDVKDQSGNNIEGNVFGATLIQDRYGRYNSAYWFDGDGDYIDTYTTFDYEYRTISLWVKTPDFSTATTEPVSIFNQDGNINYGMTTAGISFQAFANRAGGEAQPFRSDSLASNTWYHLAIVRDSPVCRFYINGLKYEGNAPGNLSSASDPYGKLVIGTDRTRSRAFFEGGVDDLKIYNCALTDAEIYQLYTSQVDTCSFTVYDTVTTTVVVYDTIAVTDTLILNVNLGINPPFTVNTIKVYPNPTNNLLIIDNGDYTEMTDYKAKIVNRLGQTIFYSPINVPSFTIQLSSFAEEGLFFLQIMNESDELVQEKKIILQ